MARHSVGRQREQTAGSNARRKSGQLNGKVAGNNENNRSESDESSDDVAPPSPRVKFELQAGTLPKSILKKPQRVYGRGNVGGQIDLIETVNRKRQYRRIMSPACVTCRRHHVGCWISLSPEYVESREGPFACDRCHKNRQACIAPCDDDEYGRRSRSRSRGRSRSVRRHCRSCSCGSSASRSRRSSSRLRSRSRRRSVSFASDVDSSTSSEGDNDESTHSKRKRRSPSHRGRSSKRRQLEPPAGTSSACTSRASGSNRTLDNGPTPSTVDEDLTQEISTLRKDMQGLSANVLVLSNSVGELKRHIASLSKDPR
ncbi:uncharacterized protein C8Q71DRAFT_105028 [Rhodofomes roseus]|uniref:Zn(2)-C6 fungal-type domain-containing protein n=1 Tax=Rhodofomes roseus TaxID=34475 RepID=A0ABQ8KCZ6_9APHY|nr:uncharacterized protein C8Q71DRAFT_105028 [Rhodofomes roseus]KAH9835127.1 hypothetical protein C8Q71DRAFT_105028 [Rhodofomes roseus]